MKLDRIHQISEIIASIAIVASLIFVGVQVNQNTQATKISNSHAALHSWNEITLAMATNPDLLRANYAGIYPELRGFFTASEDERRIDAWLFAGIKAVESNYLQWLDGNLSDELWHGYRVTLGDMAVFSGSLARYWANNGANHSVQFRGFMAELMKEAAAKRSQLIEQLSVDQELAK